jgi:small redox-active disulfide protein 2
MKVEIFGTGCPKCRKLFEHAQQAVKSLNIDVEVVKVEDIQKITDAGIMMTPALAVDGVVKSSGKVLSVEEVKKYLQK